MEVRSERRFTFQNVFYVFWGRSGRSSPIGTGNEANFNEVKMDNLEKFNAMEGNRSKELALQHARLMEKVEDLPPGTIVAPEVTAEIKRLEAHLRRRLYRHLKGDVLPILVITNGAITKNGPCYTINTQEELREEGDILFYFDVFSTLNTRIDQFEIPAPTKEEAWLKARKKSKEYPGKVHLKIS